MTSRKIFTSSAPDIDARSQSMTGIAALAAELAAEGVSVDDLFAGTGLQPWQLGDPATRISLRQRLALYRNGRDLAKRPDIGLLAGARQRISDYGIYGFAMLSSQNFGNALEFSLQHIQMAGPVVMQISFEIADNTVVLKSHGIDSLGDLLPFVAEFWRSSMTTLFSRVLETPFPSKRMIFAYPAPPHWRNYERVFNCPVTFGADTMEWHIDADLLARPCPNANPITAQVCQQFCDRIVVDDAGEAELPRRIRTICMNSSERFPPAESVAKELGLSLRTLHRHLASQGYSYQGIVDRLRGRIAIELLENTTMRMDQIAERVGFSDATSFRKAFVKWTGRPPTAFRRTSNAIEALLPRQLGGQGAR